MLRNIIRKIIVERIQLIQEGKKDEFLELVDKKKMSQDNFESMFKSNGDFKKPFSDIHFRYVLFNTINKGENHSFKDVTDMYQVFYQKIFDPYNKGILKDRRIPGESFKKYPINNIIQNREGTYDSLMKHINILKKTDARSNVLQNILDKGFQGDKNNFEVIHEGDDWIVVYPQTYLGSIATARMGPDKKYYTPPEGIGNLNWCTSIDSLGNAFLNYHVSLNLHMYYFTKKSGFNSNESIYHESNKEFIKNFKVDPNKKLCVSIAKNNGLISITKDHSTVNGLNTRISEEKIKSIIGDDLLNIIKSDASSPSRPEIDPQSYYKSISIEIYKDMRKANEENIELFSREVLHLAGYTENLEIIKEILDDPETILINALVKGYKNQSDKITRFLYENEDLILSINPKLKNVGIFKFDKRYASNITIDKFINDLPELKDENSLKFYGYDRWIPSPGVMMSLFEYNRDYEIANVIIHDDVRYLKMFLKYANVPAVSSTNIPYQKAIQDNIEYILDNVPSFATMKIPGVTIPFSLVFKKFKNNKKAIIPYVISLMTYKLNPEESDEIKENIENIINNIIQKKDVESATALAFAFELCKAEDSLLFNYFLKFKSKLKKITIVKSREENTKIVEGLAKRNQYQDAYKYMKSMQDTFHDTCDYFDGLITIIKRNEAYYYDESPMFADVKSETLEKIYQNVLLFSLDTGLDFLKKKESDSLFVRSNEKYPKLATLEELHKVLLKHHLYTPKNEAATHCFYNFGYVYFDVEGNFDADAILKNAHEDLIKNGYAIVSKPYFEEQSTNDVVFPFGEESHLFNPDEAFIIKHYGDVFA